MTLSLFLSFSFPFSLTKQPATFRIRSGIAVRRAATRDRVRRRRRAAPSSSPVAEEESVRRRRLRGVSPSEIRRSLCLLPRSAMSLAELPQSTATSRWRRFTICTVVDFPAGSNSTLPSSSMAEGRRRWRFSSSTCRRLGLPTRTRRSVRLCAARNFEFRSVVSPFYFSFHRIETLKLLLKKAGIVFRCTRIFILILRYTCNNYELFNKF